MDKKIFLLADDDIDDRELFCEALHSVAENVACHVVADGREALATLHNMDTPPQAIFLDINMPVMDGWQCLKKLKEDQRYKDIPVIIISTSSHQREIDIAKTLHALCYFTKPHQYSELTHILRTIATNLGPQLPTALQTLESNGSQYIHTFI